MKRVLLAILTTAASLAGLNPVCGQVTPTLIDFGAVAPVPGLNDAYQLTSGSGNPDGLNYYFDNGNPPGQTFTTGASPAGYFLDTVALLTAGNSGNLPAGGQAYILRLYSVSGTNATLMASYTSENNFVFTDLDWLLWTNLPPLALPANTEFAYSFARATAGWENMANVTGNLYTGGEVALIPPLGGGMTLGSSHSFDAAFDIGLAVATNVMVNPLTVSPAIAVTRGTAVTISAMAVGPSPLTYQWQTDGGSGGALTNIPAATGLSLAVSTAGLTVGSYKYDVVVAGSSGSVTSLVANLAIYTESSASLADAGGSILGGADDITQLVGGGDRDGLNYYDDNGANHGFWTGQTFTTGTNTQGYYLNSVGLQTGGGGNNGTGTLMPYELFIYSITGNNATLMAHFTNASFSFTFGDWLQWSGFSLVLKSNSTYAYAFGRSASGTGWAALSCSPTNTDLYPGGQMCLIPAAGGALTYGVSGNSDAVFDIGLLPIGVGPSPVPFANPITASPSKTVTAGAQVTLTEIASGKQPLHYFWKTDGGSGTLTNIPASNATNLVVNTTGWRPGAYQYSVIVSNVYGVSTSATMILTVLYDNTTATLVDVGASIPAPVANDLSQLVAATGANNPDGLNYYFDNGNPPGQTFTTGGNPGGYTLSSLAIKMAGNRGGLPSGGQAYLLRLYTLSGGNAVLYAVYTSGTNFLFASSDWLRWSGFAVPLAANTTYAYTFARSSSGSGWENLSNVGGNPYAGGEVVLIPTGGGTPTTGSSHAYDGTFVIGLATPGYPAVGPALLSPTNNIYAGSPVVITATVGGTGPFTYQWMTDGGSGGALTNIPGATAASLSPNTSGLGGLTVLYALSAANAAGSTVGEAVSLVVQPASAPLVAVDTVPTSASRLVGASVSYSASFIGTLPMTYQWYVDRGAGLQKLPGQTNATLLLTNLTLTDTGSYSLAVTNSIGFNSSTPATLTVAAVPSAPFTVSFQWHSTEGGNDVGAYTGAGIAGYGSGTFWNQVIGPSSWSPGKYSSVTGTTDDGIVETGYSMTLVTGGSWDWSSTPTIALLDSAASAYGSQPFYFSNLLSGVYNLVLFSCNGTESLTANAAALFTVNGLTRVAAPTQDTSFVESNNYVVFKQIGVTGSTLAGTWAPANGKSYGSLNGAQLQYLGPAVTLAIIPISATQLQLQWSQGTLLEATSLTGPWTTNTATSPYTPPTTGAQKFYRVIVR